MSDPFSWQVAVTVLGSITVTVLGIAGFAIKYFSKGDVQDHKIYKSMNELENRTIKLEMVSESNMKQLDNLSNRMDNQMKRETDDLDRMDKKIDKLTNMMIDILTSDKDTQK